MLDSNLRLGDTVYTVYELPTGDIVIIRQEVKSAVVCDNGELNFRVSAMPQGAKPLTYAHTQIQAVAAAKKYIADRKKQRMN